MVTGLRAAAKAAEFPPEPNVRAPVLDPTCERAGVRFPRATRLVVLVDSHTRHHGLLGAVVKRLREEFAQLHVEINEEKTRIVDLCRGDSFGYLGFEFRRVRTRKGAWRPHYAPKLKKRTALLQKLKEAFGRSVSQPVGRVIAEINPILRGWVNYFAAGCCRSDCFAVDLSR